MFLSPPPSIVCPSLAHTQYVLPPVPAAYVSQVCQELLLSEGGNSLVIGW